VVAATVAVAEAVEGEVAVEAVVAVATEASEPWSLRLVAGFSTLPVGTRLF
jgi:hypothetical protein